MRPPKVFARQVRSNVSSEKQPAKLYEKELRSFFTVGEGKSGLSVPVQFVVQGAPSAQRAHLFSAGKSTLRFEKGRALDHLIKKNPLWFKIHAGKVVDSMAEAIFEQAVQRGVRHHDLNPTNILIRKEKKLLGKPGIKTKIIDWSSASIISRNFDEEMMVLSQINKSYGGIKPTDVGRRNFHSIFSRVPDVRGPSNFVLGVIEDFPFSNRKKEKLKQRFLKRLEELAEERL